MKFEKCKHRNNCRYGNYSQSFNILIFVSMYENYFTYKITEITNKTVETKHTYQKRIKLVDFAMILMDLE